MTLPPGAVSHGRVLTRLPNGQPSSVGVFTFKPQEDGKALWVDWWVWHVGYWGVGRGVDEWGFCGDYPEQSEWPFTYAPEASGFTKWDGCTEITMEQVHCCGAGDVRHLLRSVGLALQYAESLMSHTLGEPGGWLP